MRSAIPQIGFAVTTLVAIAVAAPLFGDDSSATKNSEKPSVVTTELPKAVDLRPIFKRWNLAPKRQGARNTCSVFTTTGALEFAVSKHYDRGTRLSVEYLNWACNQVIHNEKDDRGQFFHDLLKGFQKYGICSDVNMPYKDRFDPQLKPSETAVETAKEIKSLGLIVHWIKPWKPQPGLTDDHMREIKTVLAKGYPVAAGASHSRLLVGYREDPRQPGGGSYLAKDSGTGKFNTVTYEFVKQKVGDLFWIEAPAEAPTKPSVVAAP